VATAGTAAIAALRARNERRFGAELGDMVVLSRRTTAGEEAQAPYSGTIAPLTGATARTGVMGHVLPVMKGLGCSGVFRFTTGKVRSRHRTPVI
jgi:hypothetical protein